MPAFQRITGWAALVTSFLFMAPVAPMRAGFDGFNVLSSTFDNQYNGNQIWDDANEVFLNAWSGAGQPTGNPFPVGDLSLNGSNLVYSQSTPNGWFQHDTGTTPWEVVAGSNSWTVEVRARVGANASGNNGFNLWGTANGERDILVAHEASVTNLGGTSYSTADNTDGFHNYRLVYDSVSDVYHYFRDAVQITPTVGVGQQAVEANARLIIGDCCTNAGGVTGFGGAGNVVEYEYVRYDMDGAFSPIADQGTKTLTINRATGNMTLTNTSGTAISNIIGYSILSDDGSLSQANWDKQTGSSQLANDNDTWTVLTGAGVTTDLSEQVLATSGDGNGGDLVATTGAWNFGNVWRKSHIQDVTMEILLNDGTILASGTDFSLAYSGAAIDPADLDANGTVISLDWVAFKNAYGTNVTGMTDFDAYHNGDINLDGTSNQLDFVAYRAAYTSGSGSGASVGAGVPEPATWCLLLLGIFAFFRREACMRIARSPRLGALALVALVTFVASPVQAQILVPIFNDNFESYTAADPADFATGANNWVHNGLGTAPNASRIFASGNFVPSGTTKLWIANAANAAAGTGINSNTGITVSANTDYTFKAALVAETSDAARTATGTYDILVGATLGTATSRIGGPQAFTARGDFSGAVPGSVDNTYDDQFTIDTFNSGVVGAGDKLFIKIAYNGTNATNPFVGVDEVSINRHADTGIRVNTTTGAVNLIGDPTASFDFTSYSITSNLGQLVAGSLTSLESQHIGDPGMNPDNGVGFEVLGTPDAFEIIEADLTGSTTFGSATNYSLGNIFNTATLPASRDLAVSFTLPSGQIVSGAVRYVAGLTGDYNGNGKVDAADYVVWRKTGINGQQGYNDWRANFGAMAGSSSGGAVNAAVPEPSSLAILLAIVGGAALWFRRRQKELELMAEPRRNEVWWNMESWHDRAVRSMAAIAFVAYAAAGSTAFAAVTLDRDYKLGDDSSEGASAGIVVGSGAGNPVPNATLDSKGVPSTGNFQDVDQSGSPTYVNVGSGGLNRPGAGIGTLGVQFDGTDDRLFGLDVNGLGGLGFPGNSPAQGGFQNPYDNYAQITSRGIQLWVRPTNSGSTARQDIINDTYQFGLHITATNTWGMTWGSTFGANTGRTVDSTEPVAYNTWTHVMQHSFGSGGGVLYVDGVAVAASGFNGAEFYHPNNAGGGLPPTLDISVGANLVGDGRFFTGALDDIEIYVAGDNTGVAPHAGITQPGMNYGTFNVGTDNRYIASLGLVPGDVTGDGLVMSTGTTHNDVAFFIDHWRDEHLVMGRRVGDLISRTTKADLNFDGITSLADAFILHNALLGSGSGSGLDFSLLGGGVPEPTSAALMVMGLIFLRPTRMRRQ